MASPACSQSGNSPQLTQTPQSSPSLQVRSGEAPAQSEACNVSFNVWVKPSSASEEEDTASSSSCNSKQSAEDLLRCDEEIGDDSLSASSKRPAWACFPEGRPAKRLRATYSPVVKDASPLPCWDLLSFGLLCP